MALNLKTKLKNNLKNKLENEGGNKKDTRFLNYYDLKEGEKMKVLILPDTNGELWSKFKLHGPNLKLPKAGKVNCAYTSSGDDCPACKVGFEYLNLEKETGDKAYREEAKRWFGKDYTVMSVLVLEAPFDVDESPDGNMVKLMYVPYAIENKIKEAIVEGQIEEDELTSVPFYIKKTKNSGGWAEYVNSYFDRKPVTDEELSFFEDFKVEQFDYTNLDVIPAATTTSEVQEWLDKAMKLDEANNSDDSSDKEEETPKKTEKKVEQKMSEKAPEPEPEEEESVEEEESSEEEGETTAGSSLKERLASLRG